jgi:hypothetical protein
MRVPSGSADRYAYFVAVDATDFTTRETGLSSFTVYRSRNGAAAAAMTTPTINETDATNMPGVYELLLDEDTTIDAGDDEQEMVVHITHAGMAPVTRAMELYRPKITEGNVLGVESDGDLTKVNTLDGHTAQTGDSFARLGAPAGASVSADIAAIEAQTDDIGAAGAGLTAVPWNASWDAEVQSEVADALAVFFTSAAALVDLIWDELLSGHTTTGTAGKALADAGSAGDPWSTALPGAYGAGTAGKIVGDNIDAPISDVDTVVDAILALLGTPAADVSADIAEVLTQAQVNNTEILNAINAINALNDISAADVNAQVVDALATDTYAEPGQGAPAATATLAAKIGYLFKAFRNKVDMTTSELRIYNDDAATVDQKATLSDDGTTTTRGEMTTGA